MTSPLHPKPYRVIVTVSRDYLVEVPAGSARAARQSARDVFGAWSPLEEACHVVGPDRVRVRLDGPAAGRCPYTDDFWAPEATP